MPTAARVKRRAWKRRPTTMIGKIVKVTPTPTSTGFEYWEKT